MLRNSGVGVCVKLGAADATASSDAKFADARKSLFAGAGEFTFPLNAMAVKSGRMSDVRDELSQIVRAATGKARISVSVDIAVLDDDEMLKVLSLIKGSGADYVELDERAAVSKESEKSDRGIDVVRRYLGFNVGVKVGGDFRTPDSVKEMIDAGADKVSLPDALGIIREIEGKRLVG
jgi:deoxyribose-phosphate aldolase